jgi:predicted nucleic acid-binding Zn ribbon protein
LPQTIDYELPNSIPRMKSANDADADFAARREREQRRHYARRPKKIADVLAQLITARGYGRIQADGEIHAAWQAAVGMPLARFTRPGRVRRGQLEITVSNSTIVQELTFERQRILAALQAEFPQARIRDIRFRIGTIE